MSVLVGGARESLEVTWIGSGARYDSQVTKTMSDQPNIRQRVYAWLDTYGVPATKAVYKSYKLWCDLNPTSRICGSRASVDAFANHYMASATATTRRRGVASASAPVAYAMTSQRRVGHSISCRGDKFVVRGTDMLTNLSTGSTVNNGSQLVRFVYDFVSPLLVGTRQVAYSQMWEKWHLSKLSFHYQPSVATSTSGQMILAWDNDPNDAPPPQDDSGIRALYSYQSNVTTSVWAPASLNVRLDATTLNLFTSPGTDSRLTGAGQLVAAVVASAPVSTTLGTLWMDYELEFSSPSELRTGPADAFHVLSSGAMTVTAIDSILTSINLGAGVLTNAGGISVGNDPNGRLGYILPTGSYLLEVELELAGGAVATTASIDFITIVGSGGASLAGSVAHASTVAANQTIHVRWALTVFNASTVVVTPRTNAAQTYSTARCAIRQSDLVVNSSTLSTQVDQYPW